MEWDFIANGAVDALEVVPEAYRGYYEENKAEGKFTVKADVKPLAEAYSSAMKNIKDFTKRKKEDNNKDAARRTILDTITAKLTENGVEVGEDIALLPDVIANTITELTNSVKGGKEAKVNLEAIKKDFEKRFNGEKTKFENELGIMRGSLEKYMVNAAAATALAQAGTVDKGLDLLMPIISKSVKVIKDESNEYSVKVVDDENNVRTNGRGENMTITDLVAELKTNYPMAFKSEAKGGGGAPAGKQGNGKLPGAAKSTPGAEKTATQKIQDGLAAMRR